MVEQVLMVRPDGATDNLTINSALYACPSGVPILVRHPHQAESVSQSAINVLIRDFKWLRVSPGLAGPTTARPQSPEVGDWFTDTTLGLHLIYYGATSNWVNSITGAANQ